MPAGSRAPGNAGVTDRENLLVRLVIELMEVIQDLCGCAAALSVVGDRPWAAALIEQCGELLAHRARLISELHAGAPVANQSPATRGSSRIRGSEWTN